MKLIIHARSTQFLLSCEVRSLCHLNAVEKALEINKYWTSFRNTCTEACAVLLLFGGFSLVSLFACVSD